MSYDQILASEIATAVRASDATVREGQAAAQELAITEDFIVARTSDLVKTLLECDPTNLEVIRVLAIGLRALRELHNHLTKKVEEGRVAAMNLAEQTAKGEANRS